MDADRFDALARALDGGSRRRFLGTLSGLALGTLSPLLGLADAEGKKKKKKKKKHKKKDKDGCDWFAGEELCGGRCCNVLVDYCCDNKSCCPREKGCSKAGLCSECPPPNDPCLKAVCGPEGLVRYDPKCPPDTKCCSGTCCPLEGNKCCPGRTGCWDTDPETPCPA